MSRSRLRLLCQIGAFALAGATLVSIPGAQAQGHGGGGGWNGGGGGGGWNGGGGGGWNGGGGGGGWNGGGGVAGEAPLARPASCRRGSSRRIAAQNSATHPCSGRCAPA